MKDKDFDFDRVGKRLPYRVDEEALQRVTRNAVSYTHLTLPTKWSV